MIYKRQSGGWITTFRFYKKGYEVLALTHDEVYPGEILHMDANTPVVFLVEHINVVNKHCLEKGRRIYARQIVTAA